MGKSRTSPLSKTSSGIGIGGGIIGGSGGGAGISAGGGAGGASASSSTLQTQGMPQPQQVNPNQPIPQSIPTPQDALVDASKTASVYGNNTASMFNGMTDDQMAQAVKNSRNVDMPNHIADVSDITQNFTYANGLNAKPTVLSNADFDNYIKQNNISSNEYLLREVDPIRFNSNGVQFTYSADDVTDMFKTSDINYIGGKHGGQAYGAGTYFAQGDFNYRTGYGSGADGVGHKTMVAVFDKSKARAISMGDIRSEWSKFSKTHAKTASAVDNLPSSRTHAIKALLMGYNVITSQSSGSLKGYGEYYNIIDRSALVVRAGNRK